MVDADFSLQALNRLSRVLNYWTEEKGFQFVSLPWVAPSTYTDATKPSFVTQPDIHTPHGNLVSSGEQSFLMLENQGLLPFGDRFIGWTPCFRQEDVYDEWHHLGFMKAELFLLIPEPATLKDIRDAVMSLLLPTKTWMNYELAASAKSHQNIQTELIDESQFDLTLGGIEVGSYGYRQFKNFHYVYGTALAEPRFTNAIKALHEKSASLSHYR